MKKYTCPSCGAAYNGKRCRECYYEHFTEEIPHRNHTHRGEPLVIKGPVRKPIPRKDPFDCDEKTRKPRKFRPILLVLLLALVNPLLGILGNVGAERVGTIGLEPEPEPFLPADALVLNTHPEVAVYAQWEPGQTFDGSLPIYIQNNSKEDVSISSWNLCVNGYILDDSALFGHARRGEITRTELYLDEEDLAHAGIGEIGEISFALEVYEDDSYATLERTSTITLDYATTGGESAFTPDGPVLLDTQEIQVRYLGFVPDAYDPEAVQWGALLFYVENHSAETIQVDLAEPFVNGEEVVLYAFTELPPQSKTVLDVGLYGLEDLGIETLEEFRQLSFKLAVWNTTQYDVSYLSDEITLSIP